MVTSEDVYAGTNKTSVWYFRAFQDKKEERRKLRLAWPRRLALWEKYFQTSVSEKDGGVGRLQLINFLAALGVKLFCG